MPLSCRLSASIARSWRETVGRTTAKGRRVGTLGSVIQQKVLSPDDWQVWRSLRLAALAEDSAAFGSALADWTGGADVEQRWRGRLTAVHLNLVLTLDGRPAGMVSATTPRHDGAVELMSLWIAPFARGHGVGDAAIDSVIAWAGAEYGDAPVVVSVKTDNEPATRLYRRHGFRDAGPSPDDPTERLMHTSRRNALICRDECPGSGGICQ
jgi:ribosomal protein S18 acetylase RimI-like enzyme